MLYLLRQKSICCSEAQLVCVRRTLEQAESEIKQKGRHKCHPFISYLQLCFFLFAEPHEHPDEEPPRPSKLMPQPEGLWPLGTTLMQTSAIITSPTRGIRYPSIGPPEKGAPLFFFFVSNTDAYGVVPTVNVEYFTGNAGGKV